MTKVYSSLPKGKVALWERDPRHPGGEIWIDGVQEEPYEVFSTVAVQERISRGVLVVAPEPAPTPTPARKEAKPK